MFHGHRGSVLGTEGGHGHTTLGMSTFLMFISFEKEGERERERERVSELGRSRRKKRESQAGSMLSAQSLTWGSIQRTVRS